MRVRARLLRAAALLTLPAAAALVLLAVDVLRVPQELAAEDVRFEAAPRLPRPLWDDVGALPGEAGRRLLGIEDDLGYRRLIAVFARVQPGRVQIRGPELEALSGQAQLEVTLAARRETEARRRSQLLNLLGALTFARTTTDPAERDTILRTGIGAFRTAVELDPDNADAKRNLELALRLPGAATISSDAPDQGASRGRTSGQGRSGSGY